MTFVDGDCVIPPSGGAGLLVVTGALTLDGNAPFSGLILVLGGGQLIRTGGGNGNSFGSLLVAAFGNSGNFVAPLSSAVVAATQAFSTTPPGSAERWRRRVRA